MTATCSRCQGHGYVWKSRPKRPAELASEHAMVCPSCAGTGRQASTNRGISAVGARAALAEATFASLVRGELALGDVDPRLHALVRAWVDEDTERALRVVRDAWWCPDGTPSPESPTPPPPR